MNLDELWERMMEREHLEEYRGPASAEEFRALQQWQDRRETITDEWDDEDEREDSSYDAYDV